jgi:prepilin peptidase CpaA
MQGGYFSYGLLCALAIALLIAAFTDLRRRRIDNWLNAGIALAAPLYWLASGMGLGDIGLQLGVAAGAFAVLAGLFAMGWMGGGDVKLLTALGLWIKPAWFLELILVMAIAGGVVTIIFGCWHVTRRNRDRIAIPYGVAISFAGLWTLGTHYLPVVGAGSTFG